MKQYILGAALALGLSALASDASASYPSQACTAANEGQFVTLANVDPRTNAGSYFVYQCYANQWSLLEHWVCGEFGCIPV